MEGDRMTVQWRQWFSPELVTTFSADGHRILPTVGGGGAKQMVIMEMGDPRGCSFGQIVANNGYWVGKIGIYHGCDLWFTPRAPTGLGRRDPSDVDVQPGGDNVCRYRYFRNSLKSGVDYLYPTRPENLLDVPAFGDVIDPHRYHGCIGWKAGQWITFRLEVGIAYCRAEWKTRDIPADCTGTHGRVRYWLKYADERKPWLVIDYPMPLRWRQGHSERYGRFAFLPYNTGEKPRADKPAAYTLYDDIVIARNAENLAWPAD